MRCSSGRMSLLDFHRSKMHGLKILQSVADRETGLTADLDPSQISHAADRNRGQSLEPQILALRIPPHFTGVGLIYHLACTLRILKAGEDSV